MLWKDVLHGFIDHPLDRCRTAEGRPTPYDGVWLQRGPAQVRAGLERFFGAFKAARGELDVLVLDYEAGYHWNRVRHFGAPWRTAVQADPRFPALAEELGFHDLGRIRWGNDEARQWDSVMRARVDRALEAAVFTPARKYFPHVAASNYGSYALKRQEATPNWAGLREYYETPGFGTHDSRQFYTWVPRTRPVRLDAGHTLKNAAFTGLLLDVNRLRAMKRSTRKPIHPWIAAFSWMETEDPGRKPAVSNTPYYDELVYHLALHGIETYIYWNVRVWEEGQNPVHFSKPSDDRRLDHLLAELNERLRGRRRAVLDPSPVDWQAPVIATGMRVDDRVVWRLTFRENVERIRVVVDGEPVEVRREADRAGVWLEHRGDQRLSVP